MHQTEPCESDAGAFSKVGSSRFKKIVKKAAFLLVHGASHGAWCFSKLVPYLERAGHVTARDLLGHGGRARHPNAFRRRPSDEEAFAIEPSPIAAVTLADYVSDVMQTLDALVGFGGGPVILLGHSMGGIPITAVGEAAPKKVLKLNYLTAYMPASGAPAIAYNRAPEAEGGKIGAAMKADPARVGALRTDPRSVDPADVANLKQAFANDVSEDEWAVAQDLLSSDAPALPFATSVETTRSRWGSIPRVYIKCRGDLAIMPRTQEKFVELADEFTPQNRTEVYGLDSSHSRFFSQPEKLAAIPLKLASK